SLCSGTTATRRTAVPARTATSTGFPAASASIGAGPCTGSTGCPSTASSTSPGRTPAPGAARGERARRLAREHPVHPPAAVGAPAQVGTELALVSAGLAAGDGLRRDRIGVRGAQLAEHFPEQVGELAGRADPVQQRSVLAQHAAPVDPGHVRHPEVPAHEPAGLVIGAPPQLRLVLTEPGPGEVHADVFAAVLAGLAAGRDHPDVSMVLDDGPLAVAADREAVELAAQLSALPLGEIEPLQRHALWRRVQAGAALTQHAAERLMQPGEPVGHGTQLRVAGLGH